MRERNLFVKHTKHLQLLAFSVFKWPYTTDSHPQKEKGKKSKSGKLYFSEEYHLICNRITKKFMKIAQIYTPKP